jgi:hypothetical protein
MTSYPEPWRSDATNYLGGVAHFALYRSDLQFDDVRYWWEQGPDVCDHLRHVNESALVL